MSPPASIPKATAVRYWRHTLAIILSRLRGLVDRDFYPVASSHGCLMQNLRKYNSGSWDRIITALSSTPSVRQDVFLLSRACHTAIGYRFRLPDCRLDLLGQKCCSTLCNCSHPCASTCTRLASFHARELCALTHSFLTTSVLMNPFPKPIVCSLCKMKPLHSCWKCWGANTLCK